MTIRPAEISDMYNVSAAHRVCFPETQHFTTLMGGGNPNNLTQMMYTEYLREDNLFLVAENEGNIIGFCMGFLNGSQAMKNFYKRYGLRLAGKTILLLLKGHPLVWEKVLSEAKRVWRRIKPSTRPTKNKKTVDSIGLSASLLSICVLPAFQGTGVSRTLICEFEQMLHDRCIKRCSLSTWRDNARAIGFYEKMGYRVSAYYGKDSVLFCKDL